MSKGTFISPGLISRVKQPRTEEQKAGIDHLLLSTDTGTTGNLV